MLSVDVYQMLRFVSKVSEIVESSFWNWVSFHALLNYLWRQLGKAVFDAAHENGSYGFHIATILLL